MSNFEMNFRDPTPHVGDVDREVTQVVQDYESHTADRIASANRSMDTIDRVNASIKDQVHSATQQLRITEWDSEAKSLSLRLFTSLNLKALQHARQRRSSTNSVRSKLADF